MSILWFYEPRGEVVAYPVLQLGILKYYYNCQIYRIERCGGVLVMFVQGVVVIALPKEILSMIWR
jgi:hypothetical protein